MGVVPHEETFFTMKSEAPIHEVMQLGKPFQEGKVKC